MRKEKKIKMRNDHNSTRPHRCGIKIDISLKGVRRFVVLTVDLVNSHVKMFTKYHEL